MTSSFASRADLVAPPAPCADGCRVSLRSAGREPSADLDTLWPDIHRSASALANREPILLRRLDALILQRSSLPESVAAILADRLTASDLCPTRLHGLLAGVIRSSMGGLPAKIAADLHALRSRDPACLDALHGLMNMKGFHALQTYRVAHALWHTGRTEVAFALTNAASRVFGVDIHPAARIEAGVMLDHGSGIVIGETAVVEQDVSILQNVTLGGTGKERGNRHPKVRRGVTIGAGAIILGNIEIGEMSKIAAGSVVLAAVPAHCTVAGVPARVVRSVQPGQPSVQNDDQSLGVTPGSLRDH